MTRSAAGKPKILIIGGGSAGLTLAARLRRAGEHDIKLGELILSAAQGAGPGVAWRKRTGLGPRLFRAGCRSCRG
jgi:2-polyprenyl-6-methoxyphenol hydroxylase-like FAD-dependent oxidoreductase